MEFRVVASEPDVTTNRAVSVPFVHKQDGYTLTLEGAIAGWLHENRWQPTRRESSRTGWEYAADVAGYRATCQRNGVDLDSANTAYLGQLAQAWARVIREDGRPISPATHNRRLASVSSFYHYALRYDLLDTSGVTVRNPIDRVKREKVQPYAAAQALDQGNVEACLAAIDLATLDGKRDYALLLVAFTTGRRVAELAGMRWGDVQVRDAGRVARIHWRQMKGGKQADTDLDPAVTDALLAWLHAAYGARIGSLATTAPIWLPLQHGRVDEERPMKYGGIRALCEKRLHVTKVHTTRHTFSDAMLASGASVVELQEQLAHSSLETTGHYAKARHGATNPYAGKLAAYFGVGARPKRTSGPLARKGE